MFSPRIQVLPTAGEASAAVADIITNAADAALSTKPTFSLILSGGSTPRPAYELLAGEPYRSRIDWAHLEVYFADERAVPPDHADSNFRMVNEALLSKVPLPPDNIHRIRAELGPEPAAIEYGQLLKHKFADGGADLALLGMGDDGHTASLFPGSAALAETHHRCVADYVEKLSTRRITLTAPFLNRSALICVLVTGQAKAATVSRVLEGSPDPLRYPIQLIEPRAGALIWIMDAAAAAMS